MLLNHLIVSGNLTAVPTYRQTKSGTDVCNFAIGHNQYYRDNSGEKMTKAHYFHVAVFGERQVAFCREYLDRGTPVIIQGKLSQDRWEDAEGQPRSAVNIVCTLLGGIQLVPLPERQQSEEELRKETGIRMQQPPRGNHDD